MKYLKITCLFLLVLMVVVVNANVILNSDLDPGKENKEDVWRSHHSHHPKILSGNLNVTSFEGETVTLPCEVANLNGHHVIWLKMENDTPLTLTVGYEQFSRNMRYRVARMQEQNDPENVESWNFEIRKVNKDDAGLYECHIKVNSKHKIKASVYLHVLSEKEKQLNNVDTLSFYSSNYIADQPSLGSHVIENKMETIELPEHSLIKLKCNTTSTRSLSRQSHSHYDIQWYKDGKLIELDTNTKRLKKSSGREVNYIELEIDSIDPNDSGHYQCRRNAKVLKNYLLKVFSNTGNAISAKTSMLVTFILFVWSLILNKAI